MRVFLEPTNWRILLEEGDKRPVSISSPPEIKTVQYGILRDGIEIWDEHKWNVLTSSQVRLLKDTKLDEYAVREHKKKHPLDLYSLFETESEWEGVPETESEGEPEPKRAKTSLSMQVKRGTTSWTISGKGRNAWANGLTVDLNGLSGEEKSLQLRALKNLRHQWNQGRELVPHVKQRSRYAKIMKADPNCKFVLKGKKVEAVYESQAKIERTGIYTWDMSDDLGNRSTLDLTRHPERRRMVEAVAWYEYNLKEKRSLAPVLEQGIKTLSSYAPEVTFQLIEEDATPPAMQGEVSEEENQPSASSSGAAGQDRGVESNRGVPFGNRQPTELMEALYELRAFNLNSEALEPFEATKK